jgi:hypothetical protein
MTLLRCKWSAPVLYKLMLVELLQAHGDVGLDCCSRGRVF